MSAAVLERLRAQFGEAVVQTHSKQGDDTAVLRPDAIAVACAFLRDDPDMAFEMCTDITAVDYLGKHDDAERFEVVYHLYSLTHGHRVRLKVRVGDFEPSVPTVSHLWGAANWAEREVWDMYGIRFAGHPDLRRILNFEGFHGHPLRKDYPLEGEQSLVEEGPVSTEGVCTPIHDRDPQLPVIDESDEKAPRYGDAAGSS